MGRPDELLTEGSEEVLCAVLIQEKKIIGVFSFKLNESKFDYTVVEEDLLAILKLLSSFKNIIFSE